MTAGRVLRTGPAHGSLTMAVGGGHVAIRVAGRTGRLRHYLVDGRWTVAARSALDALESAARILPEEAYERHDVAC